LFNPHVECRAAGLVVNGAQRVQANLLVSMRDYRLFNSIASVLPQQQVADSLMADHHCCVRHQMGSHHWGDLQLGWNIRPK